ncbi:hypothetical protein SNE40_013236 [Patella caerulea]|uniref:Sushi domain-containing protein n=1 Tax=Patella caerulea TaxID=87958 RepID=A0AAN8JIX4_PATCE
MECKSLTDGAKNASLILSSTDSTINTTVTITCSDSSQRLVGWPSLTCLTNSKWSSSLPYCTENDGFTERERLILSVMGSILLVILLTGLVIFYCWCIKRRKHKQKQETLLARTMHRISLRDPLDELTRRESRRSYGEQSASEYYTEISTKRNMFKIWTVDRNTKTFTFASDVQEVLDKGATKLGLMNPSRLVLEDDGTEIDCDEALQACAGKVIMILEKNDRWEPKDILLNVESLPDISQQNGKLRTSTDIAYL